MFIKKRAENGVEYFISDILPCTHAFSTRIGGASKLAHTASLNLAFGRGDGKEIVLENVSRFADAVGFNAKELISVPQIHSDIIIDTKKEMLGEGVFRDTDKKGDGYLITERGIFAAVKTADCVPVLLCDRERGICCAVHAGWRGTFSLIAARAVRKMLSLGSKPPDIFAAIGPAINGECYEVGREVYEAAHLSGVRLEACFIPRGDKYLCNLKLANALIIQSAGVPAENIDICLLCTHCESELFYSHRKSGGERGTMMAVIGMRE